MKKKINIAIDGHSACGKSTTAKALAKSLNYIYIDTGAMYRAVTLYFIRNNIDWLHRTDFSDVLDDINIEFKTIDGENTTFLNGENVEKDIRGLGVSNAVSPVSRIKQVREKLVALQKEMASKKGVVMDGRDIGTVVIPDAELKFFMTADLDKRVERRVEELLHKGIEASFETIKANVQKRDEIDATRAIGPLKKAENAIEIDTTHLQLEEQVDSVVQKAQEKIAQVCI